MKKDIVCHGFHVLRVREDDPLRMEIFPENISNESSSNATIFSQLTLSRKEGGWMRGESTRAVPSTLSCFCYYRPFRPFNILEDIFINYGVLYYKKMPIVQYV